MKSIITTFSLLLFVAPLAFSQVDVSEAFQKTIKRIAKESIKKEVISWVTEQDPISGIVARDLITQLIDGKNQQTLLRSTTNVVTTMLFLGGIKSHIERLVDATDGIVQQAASAGWTRNQLVAYSCLYYYYSERIKAKLYVSSEILKMSEEKSSIESFKSSSGRKWIVIVSGELVQKRYTNRDLSVDVRLLELLDKSVWHLISDRKTLRPFLDSMIVSLRSTYSSDRVLNEVFESILGGTSNSNVLQTILGVYEKPFLAGYSSSAVFSSVKGENVLVNDSDAQNSLTTAYSNLIATANYDFVDHEQVHEMILGLVRDLLEKWISNGRQDGWKVDYVLSLAGTALGQRGNISGDFTVLDQIRFARHFESSVVFFYIGGFFDPFLKNTINKGGAKVYMTGIGFGWQSYYVSVSAGIEYPQVLLRNTRMGISIGYEIPVADILE